jgi:hypothetical protein
MVHRPPGRVLREGAAHHDLNVEAGEAVWQSHYGALTDRANVAHTISTAT